MNKKEERPWGEFLSWLAEFFKETKKDFIPSYKALRSHKKRWRSPIRKGALYFPGSFARRKSLILVIIIALVIFNCFFFFLGQVLSGWGLGVVWITFGLLLAAIPVWAYQNDNYFLGELGEREVADELNKLGRPKWRIYHGVESEYGGDIDHIIVCSKGIFCVETKTLRENPDRFNEKLVYERRDDGSGFISRNGKPLDTPDPIKQVRKNSEWLHGYLSEKCRLKEGEEIPFAVSIVTFPGWSMEIPTPNYDENIIPCKPESIKTIFKKREDILNFKMIEKIGKAIEEINRSDITDAP